MELTITKRQDEPGAWTIILDGALDLQSRDDLIAAATEVFQSEKATSIALDLAAVNFIDSTGIGAIVRIAGEAEDVGARFVLSQPSARVLRILQIAGLQDAWPIEPIEPTSTS